MTKYIGTNHNLKVEHHGRIGEQMALRTATYAHAFSGKCDWCLTAELPRRAYKDPHIVKFVSAVDGNYVRARLCDDCKPKFERMCERAR